MKNLYRIFRFPIFCVLLIGLVGCEDVLDTEVPSDIVFGNFPANGQEAQALLQGIYRDLKDDYNNTYYHEDRGDGFEVGVIGTVSDAWSQNITATNGTSWTTYYGAINNINYLLYVVDDLAFSKESDRDQLKAEALFLRATYYFFMAKIWGDVPLLLEPVISPDTEVVRRSPVAQVFTQINADISEALSLFPNDGFIDKNFASKPATYALQADVKMWTGKVLGGGAADFDAALSAIQNIENQGASLLDSFADVFDTKNHDEIIFAIFNDRDEVRNHYASTLSVRDVNYDPEASPGVPGSSSNVRHNYSPSEHTRSLFANDTDVRQDRTFLPFYLESGGPIISYSQTRYYGEIIDGVRLFTNDFIIYRWADMLLLRAEAYAAKNDLENAVIALNLVRNRAGNADYSGLMEQGSVNLEILAERGRELFLEPKRWWDLRRFHADGTIDVYSFVPNLQGMTTPLYWSVSQSVMAENTLIEQTEGYD
ncbi:RagB/SusD family nutrient uptake outer membrane protein [uncultured Kriegella sp.]|uniref:RagB/SusD family nutrient uptake outer membrane protein n=1 Tax=uncultured Kriegella sp. TaxID=1798910 RepID=UPI0030D9411A|tara:strand:+ start:9212 stop:10657 length:1446 start_codon:yes stop_codon:yes gene_type:complete